MNGNALYLYCVEVFGSVVKVKRKGWEIKGSGAWVFVKLLRQKEILISNTKFRIGKEVLK